MKDSLRNHDLVISTKVFMSGEHLMFSFGVDEKLMDEGFFNDMYESLWYIYFFYSNAGKTVLFDLSEDGFLSKSDFEEILSRVNKMYGCYHSGQINFKEIKEKVYGSLYGRKE